MAQQGKPNRNAAQQTKQKTRAARRAREEAEAQALAEQEAKERRQQTTVGVVVVAVIVLVIAVIASIVGTNIYKSRKEKSVTAEQTYAQLQEVKVTPKGANKQGGFLFSRDGFDKKAPGAPTVEIYMDPLCPGCGALHQQVGPMLKQMLDAGQVNLAYYPMNFEDPNSTDHYSTRAAGAISYVASHDPNPDHLLGFIDNLYSKDFQPQEGSGYKPTSNDQIKEQALKAGVPKNVADKAFGGEYNDWINAAYKYTVKRPELWHTSGQLKGGMSTPTVTINGTRLDSDQIASQQLTQQAAILQSLGLAQNQVGQAGQMPSIGAKGKPNALV